MSLRLRLLLAVGVVALTALAIADVVTYQELRSFLYNRIDQSLDQSHMPIELGAGEHAPRRGSGPPPRVAMRPRGQGECPRRAPNRARRQRRPRQQAQRRRVLHRVTGTRA